MTKKKLSGLFINCVEAQDSIFESGKMAYDCLLNSTKYSLDYLEITEHNVNIPTNHDFYLFNYHHITMSWLDTKCIKSLLPGIKLTLVLEVSPNDPFVFCPRDDFDAYCVLDPTLKLNNSNVYAFPRPLETFGEIHNYLRKEVPVIGTFGFATTGKGFEHVVDAVNREFEKAVVRINIPYASYADESHSLAKKLGENCKRKAKSGVEVVITHDFMSKSDLIKWCGQNTLNCFLYDRNMPGLAATTDQAISSGRPLITSKNNTFRHIQSFIKPFPFQLLKDAIANSQPSVKLIQKEWSAEKFREKFESVLKSFEFTESPKNTEAVNLNIISSSNQLTNVWQKLKKKIAIRTRLDSFLENGTLSRKSIEKKHNISSNSQFGEDNFIRNFFDEIPLRYLRYLDIGANNVGFGETYSFYKNGFTGVLVEPNLDLAVKLRETRPRDTVVNVGVWIDESAAADDSQNIDSKAKTHSICVNQLIEEHFTESPDLISIGARYFNLNVLKTFDFERFCPAVFCIETIGFEDINPNDRIDDIFAFFERNNYRILKQISTHSVFVNKNLYEFHLFQKSQREREQSSVR
jgi:hypothetical protein